MMNMETRIAIANKEIEVYESFINIIPTIAEVIRRFDNKCINKRFTDALDKAVNNGDIKNRKFYISTEYGYNGQFEITVHSYNDSVKEISDKEYPNHYRVDNNTYTFVIPKDNFEITESGNYRIKADEMICVLYEHKTNIIFSIESLQKGLIKANEMISEMKRIKAELEAFEKKYSYHMRDIMGVNFTLRDNTSYEYRNYDI